MHLAIVLVTLFLAELVLVASRQVVDLTHVLDKDTPKYPLSDQGYNVTLTYYGYKSLISKYYDNGMWLALGKVEYYEHFGTHIDAPIHFGGGRQTLEQIPPERLIGPGVVIDVKQQAKENPNYGVTVADIKNYESLYGRIPSRAIIMMNSGWGWKYPNEELMFGTKDTLNSSAFNFPGFSMEACQFLHTQRQVSVLGVDTTSTDPGQADDFYCHRLLQPDNVPLLEYVANLDSIPPSGTTIVLGAPKFRGGTGGPTRILAFFEDDDDDDRTNGARDNKIISGLFIWCFIVVVYVWKN